MLIVVDDNGDAKVSVLALVPVVVSVNVSVVNINPVVVVVTTPTGVNEIIGTIWQTANSAVTDEQLETSFKKPDWS